MSNQLKITISGQTGTGKSHVAQLLSEFLEAVGFDVEMDADEYLNHRKNLMDRISELSSKTSIVIEEVNLARPIRRNTQEV